MNPKNSSSNDALKITSCVREHWKEALIVLGLVLLYIQGMHNNLADFDLWSRFAAGRLLFETGAIPKKDIFSYMPTVEHWVQHGWLSAALFYWIKANIGWDGLQVLKFALGLGAATCLYFAARKQGASRVAAAMVLAMLNFVWIFGFPPIRAQNFTYFFFALSLLLLERARQDERWARLWWLVPLQLVWANFHAGFLSGIGLIVLYAMGQVTARRRVLPFLPVLVAAGLVTLLNPYGLDYWREVLLVSSAPSKGVTEWFSVFQILGTDGQGQVGWFFLGSMGVVAALLAWRNRRADFTAVIVFGVTAYLGIKHNRHMFFFFLACGAYVPLLLTQLFASVEKKWSLQKNHPKVVILGICLFFAAYFAPLPGFIYSPLLTAPASITYLSALPWDMVPPGVPYYPNGAIIHIKQHKIKGNIVSHLAWGSALLWGLYPDCRVGMDGRNESVYPEKVRTAYFDFILGKDNWRDYLNAYPHDMVLVKPFSQIGTLLAQEPGWRKEYEDKGCVLFMRE